MAPRTLPRVAPELFPSPNQGRLLLPRVLESVVWSPFQAPLGGEAGETSAPSAR